MKAKGKAVQSTCDGGSSRKDENQQEQAGRGQHCATIQHAVDEDSFKEDGGGGCGGGERSRGRTAATCEGAADGFEILNSDCVGLKRLGGVHNMGCEYKTSKSNQNTASR